MRSEQDKLHAPHFALKSFEENYDKNSEQSAMYTAGFEDGYLLACDRKNQTARQLQELFNKQEIKLGEANDLIRKLQSGKK